MMADRDFTQIERIAEHTMTYPYKVWGFGEGIALEALWEAADVLQKISYKQFVLDLFEQWLIRPIVEADHSAPGMLVLMAYEYTMDTRFLERAIALAEHMQALPQDKTGGTFHRPQHPDYHDFLYVDCMEVDAPFLCKLARVTGDKAYYDAAVGQILGYSALLQDEESGLFYHQYNGATGQVNGAFWGRGNGWALLGLLKTLLLLPANHPEYAHIKAIFTRLVDALAKYQLPDGAWSTVLNQPDTYAEASLPAMFGYGVQVGMQNGLVDAPYDSLVQNAWNAMNARLDDGLLEGVSIATPPGDAPHYNSIATASGFPWGQGPALLFALSKVD
ncbi:MAG: glycoside hydrolase family 88 protein [Aggregatilineales bacterium]